MKQVMAIVAIALIAVGFLFMVMGYAPLSDTFTGDNGNGEEGEHYPSQPIPPEGETPPSEPPYLPEYPPEFFPPPNKPLATIEVFGYEISFLTLLGLAMCVFGAVIFATGGKL